MDQAGFSIYHQVKLDRDYLSGKSLDLFGKKHPGIWRDSSATQKMQISEEFRDLIESLEESLAIGNPTLLIDHTRWAMVHLTSLGFPKKHVNLMLATLGEVFEKELPLEFRKQAVVFIIESLAAVRKSSSEIPSFIVTENPLADVATSFLSAGIAGDKERAWIILEEVMRSGTPAEEIYLNVIEPALRETGRLWQLGKVSIAQEHFVTALVETFMTRLHDQLLLSNERKEIREQKTVVAACVGSELHDIGIRMTADFFEIDGWATYYFGGNTPAKSILEAARDQNADVIALSTTMPRYLSEVQYLIRSLRADKMTSGAKIIVGGYPFRIVPDLWKQIGADAYSGTAENAVATANRLIRKTP